MSDDESNLKAGHPPAVKAGGMRIVQNESKSKNEERAPKDQQEDPTGLTTQPNISNSTVSGAPAKGPSDFPTSAVQSTHRFKPEKNVPPPQVHNINQPRK